MITDFKSIFCFFIYLKSKTTTGFCFQIMQRKWGPHLDGHTDEWRCKITSAPMKLLFPNFSLWLLLVMNILSKVVLATFPFHSIWSIHNSRFTFFKLFLYFFPLPFSPIIPTSPPQQSPHCCPCPWVLFPCSILYPLTFHINFSTLVFERKLTDNEQPGHDVKILLER